MSGDDEKGKLVDFPVEEVRMPPQRLPQPVGRIDSSHPLRKPLRVIIILLMIVLLAAIVLSITIRPREPTVNQAPGTFSETFREEGAVTYNGAIIHGWFLDPERQHFMAEDGRRFTYVDTHEREGGQVSGHWRLME